MDPWAITGLPAYAYSRWLVKPPGKPKPERKPITASKDETGFDTDSSSDWDDDDDLAEIEEEARQARRKELSDAKKEIHKLNLRAHELLTALYDQGRTNFSKTESPETVIDDEEKFQIYLKVGPFTAEEISVKEVNRNLIVEGRHVDKQDTHGFVEREFVRTYHLPKNVRWDEIIVRVTPEGVLTIDAPKHVPDPLGIIERDIPIIKHGHNVA